MTPQQIKWSLFIVPAVVIGSFETLRHTVLSNIIPLQLGNWVTALLDAAIIAILSRQVFRLFERNQRELSAKRERLLVLEERERLAREMHDQIAQSIFYTGVQLQYIQKRLHPIDDTDLKDALNDVMASLREMDNNIRQAIFNLKQPVIDQTNFTERVCQYLESTLEGNGIVWSIDTNFDSLHLLPAEQVQLFGILQEAVTNIIKHSRASSVLVSLKRLGSSTQEWIFSIEDNGIGFESGLDTPRRFGLEIIANRAREINATASFESLPSERQTRVLVTKNS